LQGESTLVVGSATLKARAGQVVVARAGWWNFPDVQPSELQAVIDRKAAVAINYPERYDGLWLLIYATGRNAAESLDMNEAAQEFVFVNAGSSIASSSSMREPKSRN
jgi:hypothetical protein